MPTIRRNAAAIVLAWTCLAATPAPGEDAAALVRAARERESWIERAESLSLKAHVDWEITRNGLDRRRRELRVRFPGAKDLEQHPDLRPGHSEEIELAFDRTRVRYLDSTNGEWDDLRIWDGKRLVCQNRYAKAPERDTSLITRNLSRHLNDLPLIHFASFRAGPHLFWWYGPEERQGILRLFPQPEDFAYEGKQPFRGVECHVVSHWGSWTTLYIAVDGGRLCGLRIGSLGGPKFEQRTDRLILEWLNRRGHAFPDVEASRAWIEEQKKTRPVEEIFRDFWREGSAKMTQVVDPCWEHTLSNEQEVAPGCWLPLTQVTTHYKLDEAGDVFADSAHRLTITEPIVDRPIPDDRFVVAFKEGERIRDEIHDPPLDYRHKASFAPEEWAKIVAEGKEEAERNQAQTRKIAALIGQTAPAFPAKAVWLNSKPLAWPDLAGRVIVLDFWAEWCGPCRGDLPTTGAIHKHRAETGVDIIGIHPPGSKPEAIAKVIEDFHLDYPICIDVPPPEDAHGWGSLYTQYAIDHIPQAAVVGRDGKIAAIGDLAEVLEKAHALAAQEN